MRKLEKFYMPKSETFDTTEKVRYTAQTVHMKYMYSVEGKKTLLGSAQTPRTPACSCCEEMFTGRGLRPSIQDTHKSCGSSNKALSHL
jgi:hypothetical protein